MRKESLARGPCRPIAERKHAANDDNGDDPDLPTFRKIEEDEEKNPDHGEIHVAVRPQIKIIAAIFAPLHDIEKGRQEQKTEEQKTEQETLVCAKTIEKRCYKPKCDHESHENPGMHHAHLVDKWIKNRETEWQKKVLEVERDGSEGKRDGDPRRDELRGFSVERDTEKNGRREKERNFFLPILLRDRPVLHPIKRDQDERQRKDRHLRPEPQDEQEKTQPVPLPFFAVHEIRMKAPEKEKAGEQILAAAGPCDCLHL